MNLNWFNNDTIALIGLILLGTAAAFLGFENISSVVIGAIGGYIGSKAI